MTPCPLGSVPHRNLFDVGVEDEEVVQNFKE